LANTGPSNVPALILIAATLAALGLVIKYFSRNPGGRA